MVVTLLLASACRGGDSPGKGGDHVEEAKGHDEKAHDEKTHDEETHAEKGHDEEHTEDGSRDTVRVTSEAMARNEIKVAEVVMEAFGGGTDVPAEITLAPQRVAHVSSLITGQVLSADVSIGDSVKQGQVLAMLRSVEVGQARSDFARAESAFAAAKANYERQQTLEKEGIGAGRALQEARAVFEAAQAELAGVRERLGVYGAGGRSGAKVAVRAPIAGTIIERHATTGEITKADEPLFVVADTSRVWVVGQVYEQNVGRVKVGTVVTLRLTAYPDRTWKSVVSYVASVLDDRSRTLPVRVELDNPDGTLRPGLYGTLTLASDESGNLVPVVPESALQRVEDSDVAFIPGADPGEFHAVPVRVAGRDRGRAAIADGLKAGARIVVSGAFVLKSELLKGEMGEGHAH